MKPSKQEWAQVIKDLDSQFRVVYLRCDGYLVSASLLRSKGNRLKVVVYVDGVIKGAWCGLFKAVEEMSNEARRFWFPAQRSLMKAKELKFWEKFHGKRECKKRGFYEKRFVPTPEWNSASSLVRHLIKHNDQIEIIDNVTYMAELEQKQANELSEQQEAKP